MKEKTPLQRYQDMVDWNLYRLKQNKASLEKLNKLLPEFDYTEEADDTYKSDYDDLLSLKIIYETGIRNLESKVDYYKALILEKEAAQ